MGLFDFIKSDGFKVAGSAILGIGVMAVLKPGCRSGECRILKAPPLEEVTKSTYQIGQKCYKFETTQIECPKLGVIEPFTR
jgi:hypothetical protein